MGRSCCVPSCRNSYNSKKKISLFKVPQTAVEAWNSRIPGMKRSLTTKDSLCEKHFLPHHIIRELKTEVYTIPLLNPKLSGDAVPSVFINSKNETQEVPAETDLSLFCACSNYQKYETIEIEEHQLTDPDLVIKKEESRSVCVSPVEEIGSLFENVISIPITLPSSSWNIHMIGNGVGSTLVLFEMIEFGNNVVVSKKVVVRGEKVSCFVFEQLIENFLHTSHITSMDQLNIFLNEFHMYSICSGGVSVDKVPSEYKLMSYERDRICNSVRHVNCLYVIERRNAGDKYLDRCKYCRNAGPVIRNFVSKAKHKRVTRTGNYERKIIRNLVKREQRLRQKNERILVELKRMRSLTEESPDIGITNLHMKIKKGVE